LKRLTTVDSAKYVSVCNDSKLNFCRHIDNIFKKASVGRTAQ